MTMEKVGVNIEQQMHGLRAQLQELLRKRDNAMFDGMTKVAEDVSDQIMELNRELDELRKTLGG